MVDSLNGTWEDAGSEDYEALPYPSMPFAYTQPARLAALAELFGLKAPDAREARVLELGCASGGNIIPLAARYPRARFLGIDLSHRHIADGRKRIEALALANIDLQQGDFAKFDFGSGRFDYLICHGVLSWVPRQAQEAIFRICEEALVANGVAAISYNVLPGWHLRTIVRDICIHHVGRQGPPRARVTNARKALELIAGSVTEKNAYGLLLRDEARRLAGRPAAYIMGEFLTADNSPCYFHEFVERAKRFNLAFLCEGDLNASIPEIQEPELRRRSRALAGSDYLALEQYIDFFTGRTFRRSILVKAEQSCHIRRNRNFERLRSLHFASASGRSLANGGDLAAAKFDRPTFKKAVADATLRRLRHAYPGTLSFPEVVPAVETGLPKADGEAIARAVFHLVVGGQATASTLPASAGRASAGQVRVWPVARLEAAAKQPWITSLNHLPVPLQHLPIALLPYLDGTRDGDALRPLIMRALLDGSIETEGGVSGRKPAQLQSEAEHYLLRALEQLQGQALLEP
jgi:SAM-dependent methyltransferase